MYSYNPAFKSHEGLFLTPDIYATSSTENWVVEVKGILRANSSALLQVLSYAQASGARPWIVVFSNIENDLREKAQSIRVMLTGLNEWEELKKNFTLEHEFICLAYYNSNITY